MLRWALLRLPEESFCPRLLGGSSYVAPLMLGTIATDLIPGCLRAILPN